MALLRGGMGQGVVGFVTVRGYWSEAVFLLLGILLRLYLSLR